MEIKTCEEYVLAELDSRQKELDAANELNEAYRKVLGAAAKYLRSDAHGNILVCGAAFDPASGRCVLQATKDDAALLSALSRLADGDGSGLKRRLGRDEDEAEI